MNSMTDNGLQPATSMVQGYSREAVDEFLVAADAERARLQQEIAEVNTRLEQVQVALGSQRAMIGMLTSAGRELQELRQRTELEAASRYFDSSRTPAAASAPTTRALDDHHHATAAPDAPEAPSVISLVEPRAGVPAPAVASPTATDDEEYFGFLRGALLDDEPLGPRPD